MSRIVSQYTGRTVRIGDMFAFPGGATVEVTEFGSETVRLRIGKVSRRYSLDLLGLEWTEREIAPSTLMTGDDWIYATNHAKEVGGGFLSALALAVQRADSGNVEPLKREYHTHFFPFLPQERQAELRLFAAAL